MASWRPQARTQVLLDQIATVLSDYADHLPLTGRQVFYRLVATMDYPKTENAYKNLLEVLNRARRAGLVAFDDIRDDGVTVIEPDGFDDMSDFGALSPHGPPATVATGKLARASRARCGSRQLAWCTGGACGRTLRRPRLLLGGL